MTLTGTAVVFLQASSAITLAGSPLPAAGVPAEAVNPFELMEIILYVAAGTLPAAVARLKFKAASLHSEVLRSARTGSGLMVTVTVIGLPGQLDALTGTTV